MIGKMRNILPCPSRLSVWSHSESETSCWPKLLLSSSVLSSLSSRTSPSSVFSSSSASCSVFSSVSSPSSSSPSSPSPSSLSVSSSVASASLSSSLISSSVPVWSVGSSGLNIYYYLVVKCKSNEVINQLTRWCQWWNERWPRGHLR